MSEILTSPGYITEFTDRGAKGRYVRGENVRFRNSLPEKIGGGAKISSGTFDGIARKIQNFKSLDLDRYLALATNKRFYIYDGGSLVNVTPQRDTGTLGSDPFDATSGSSIITVNDTGHGCEVGDIVNFDGATASPTDGITIDGDYEVLTTPDADSYTIEGGTSATATESFGGAAVDYIYEINAGYADSLVGTGWGGGAFNSGTWSTPRTGSGINLPLRTISIDEWGEDVLWNPRGGAIYVFDTSGGILSTNPATEITQAPDTAESIIVSPEDRHLIALGAHDGSDDNPMLVAWCSQEDYTDWTASALNTAGDKLLKEGTRIMLGIYARSQIVILTDTAAYSMFYIGYPEVFSISFKAKNCGAISPACAVAHGDVVYWMSPSIEFWKYDGAPIHMPCEIRDWIQARLDTTQQDKVYASLNSGFHEVWWICPNKDGGTFIVAYNYKDKFFWFTVCDNWATPPSAMIDRGEYSNKPIAACEDGYVWVYETGVDQEGTALPTELVRFYDEIGDGSDVMMTNKVIPDFRSITGSVDVTLNGLEYPQPNDDEDPTPDTTKGPYAFNSSTRKKNIRIRARQISMVISSSDAGVDWKFGTLRAEAFSMGKKA